MKREKQIPPRKLKANSKGYERWKIEDNKIGI
jgi:hypothetical protein